MAPRTELRVVLGETNAQHGFELAGKIEKLGVELCGVVSDGISVVDMVQRYMPDLLLMSMVMPQADGLEVLGRIKNMRLQRMPAVAVMVVKGMESYGQMAVNLGAWRYLGKPVTIPALQGLFDEFHPQYRLKSPVDNHKIEEALNQLGIPQRLLGYRYLTQAIALVMTDSALLKRLTLSLYPMVADQSATTALRVERSIRHAIEVAWMEGSVDRQYAYFGNTVDERRGKPTSGEFIARVAEHLRWEDRI